MASCPDAGVIQSFVENALEPLAYDEVEQHVADCSECRQLVVALQAPATAPTVSDAESKKPGLPDKPSMIGRYQVLEVLGAGGMGIVFAALDSQLRRRVAIKLLRAGSGDEENTDEARGRMLREARAMALIQHPNVVQVYDAGVIDGDAYHGEIYIAMELVKGSTLRRWIAAKPRAVGAIVDTFLEAGRGLAAAHASGLVHRDFKPDNVLVGDDGRIRVTDFGLARRGEGDGPDPERGAGASRSLRLTATGAVHGTPGYIAPEQYAERTFDARTDQFAFCVSLWEALSGKKPFTGDDALAIERAVVAGKLPSDTTLPRKLRRILERGLATTPDDRWPSMTALLAELAKTRSSKRRTAIAVAAVAAVAIGAGAWLATRDADPTPEVVVPKLLEAESEQVVKLFLSGDVAGSLAYANTVVTVSRPGGGARLATALTLRGFVYAYSNRATLGEADFREAIATAEQAGDAESRYEAIGQLVDALAAQGKTDEAMRLALAKPAARVGLPAAPLAMALDADGIDIARAGDIARGLERHRAASQLWALTGDIVNWATSQTHIASRLEMRLELDAACALARTILVTIDLLRAPPGVSRSHMEAVAAGTGAKCELARGRFGPAIQFSDRHVSVLAAQFGTRSKQMMTALMDLGRAHALAGNIRASDAEYARALALDITEPEAVTILGNQIVAALESKRPDDAVRYGEIMIERAERAHAKQPRELAQYRLMFAKVLVKANQHDRARALLEPLLIAYEKIDDPIMRADAQFSLAKALATTHKERARSLAEHARVAYRAAGSVRAPSLEDVEAFLASP